MKSNYLKIGKGTIDLVYETLIDNRINGKILFVSDPVVFDIYGEKVESQIKKISNYDVELCSNNTIEYAMVLSERCISEDYSCIIGMGGGRVLDVCKYTAYISKTPFLSIPTTISNDGIASPIAVLKRKDQKPKSLGASIASMILIDIDVIIHGPIQNIKAGIGDTISNYTALLDWEYAVSKNEDSMNGYAYIMSKTALESLMKTSCDSINEEFIELLVNSLVLSGIAMDFAGTSRPVSGSEHLFSHALDYYSDVKNLHGLQVALGTVAVLKLINHNPKDVINYLKKFGVDVNPKTLNIDRETFVKCMINAVNMRKNRFTYLNDIELNVDKLNKIYNELITEL